MPATPWTFSVKIFAYVIGKNSRHPAGHTADSDGDWVIGKAASSSLPLTVVATNDAPAGWSVVSSETVTGGSPPFARTSRVNVTAPDTPPPGVYGVFFTHYNPNALALTDGDGGFDVSDSAPNAKIDVTDNGELLTPSNPYNVDGEEVLFSSTASTGGGRNIQEPSRYYGNAGMERKIYQRSATIIHRLWSFEEKSGDDYSDAGTVFSESVLRNDDDGEYRATLVITNSFGLFDEESVIYIVQGGDLVSAMADSDGVGYAAVVEGGNLNVKERVGDQYTVKFTLPGYDSPSLYQIQNCTRFHLAARQKSTGLIKQFLSDDHCTNFAEVS